MTTSGPNANFQTKEWMENVVSDIFNELLVNISSKTALHPTEEVSRNTGTMDYSNMKIYDFINSYHAYCKLCEQHFYSKSMAKDINSFFQKHINTSYHRQIRAGCPLSDKSPILTWEEMLESGKCNLCNMQKLSPYIIDTEFDLRKLMKSHVCFWDQENRETNERVLRKFNLLKKYCGLKIFQEKYIKTINGRGVCLLCKSKLPWSGEKASCHLSSERHYQNFCAFLCTYFNFLLKDALNGFNLEAITRWLINSNLTVSSDFTDFDERELCLQRSNSEENPYSEKGENFSFSPNQIKKLMESEDFNFIHKNSCLVCNEAIDSNHMSSKLHQSKVAIIDKTSFDKLEKYLIYLQNREKRRRMIEKYKKLKSGFEKPSLPVVCPETEVNQPVQSVCKDNFFSTLFKKKMDLVNFIFTVQKSGEIFCHICDQRLSLSEEILHLSGLYHKSQEVKWNELKAHFANEKFAEPFQKVKGVILCLVCGVFFDSNSFFSHLKGGTHFRKFEWYCNQKNTVPISSSFTFRDFVCFCTLCNNPVNKKGTLKTTLKKILSHWPCPEVKQQGDKQKQTEVPSPSKTPTNSSKTNSLDLSKVEKTIENVVSVFEKNIMYEVLDKTVFLLGCLSNFRKISKKEIKKSLGMDVEQNDFENPSFRLNQSGVNQEKKELKENTVRILKNETRNQKTEENKVEPDKKPKKENAEEEHEVLVIQGLSKRKRRSNVLYEKLSPLGKIRYIFFEQKTAIVAFSEPGVAKVLLQKPNIFEEGLTMFISTRKEQFQSIEKTPEKPPLLNKELILLLQNPLNLMDFSLSLLVQALSESESPLEIKREELVCKFIYNTVKDNFPKGRCYPFGSRLSGLTLKNSDLDVFLDCGGMYEGFKNTTPSSERKLVNRVAELLRRKRDITQIVVVDRARVPIVSFLHKPTLLRCDLSFKNGLSVQNTLLIKFMISLDWRVRPLILFLKLWVKLNGLHGPPYFSSYAIAMLVIYYLEQLEFPLLPTIESLQSSYVGRRMTIGGWDCSINLNKQNIPATQNNESIPKLLLGLFDFYSNFDYQKNVISPLTGKLLAREAFSSLDGKKLPMSYKRHILNLPVPIENLVNSKICICLIDPFDLSHVLTKGITLRGLQMFTQLCKSSAEILREAFLVSGQQKK